MLCVRDLSVVFGGVRAVDSIDLDIREHTVHGLIGPNGAGKSTALNAITGVLRPNGGSVRLGNQELLGRSAAAVMRAGIARTFQQAQLWGGMNVEQNLAVPLLRSGRRAARVRVHEVAEQLDIASLLPIPADQLAFGARRLVEVARAIMSRPQVVLLDEPGAGLTRGEKRHLVQVLGELASGGTSVVLVDHDMELVMRVCDDVTVLDAGAVIAKGPPETVRTDERVIASYLGRPVR